MDHKTMLLIICLVLSTLFFIPSFLAYANDDHKEKKWSALLADGEREDDDNDKHQKRKRERHQDNDDRHSNIKPVNNPVYQTECGACHFAYQPEFLPEASWMTIIASLDDHFGESVQLDGDSKKALIDYLKSNCADHSTIKRAGRIMQGLGNQVPLRITQTPYIIKQHHDISPNVLKRKSIGSLSNCIACHTTAEDGIYDDDNVKIPQ